MQHTVFANKPAPSTGAEYANSDRRTGFAHVSRSACHGRAASPAFDGCVRYARSDSHYARASSAGLFSRRPVRGSRLRPRKDASIIRPYAIMAGVLVVVAVVVAVCATVGRGCVDAGTASGPGAIAGSISTPVGEWSQGQVPRLYQTDPAWAGAPYAGSTVEEAGCGPTCLAMVYVSITGKKDYDPASLCAFSEREGYVSGGETSWLLMSEGARKLGLMSEEVPADASSVTAALEAGKPIICSVAPGDFTTTGHFIVLVGLDDEGRLVVHDPNSAERTEQTWDLQTVLRQCRNIWAFSAA